MSNTPKVKQGSQSKAAVVKSKRPTSDALSALAGIPAGQDAEAVAIQELAFRRLGPAEPRPLGIWSGGCYYVATSRPTKKYKYGRYWRLVKCLA